MSGTWHSVVWHSWQSWISNGQVCSHAFLQTQQIWFEVGHEVILTNMTETRKFKWIEGSNVLDSKNSTLLSFHYTCTETKTVTSTVRSCHLLCSIVWNFHFHYANSITTVFILLHYSHNSHHNIGQQYELQTGNFNNSFNTIWQINWITIA